MLKQNFICLNEDKIVIDAGSKFWKIGFSGESAPRMIVSTADLGLQNVNKVSPESLQDRLIITRAFRKIFRKMLLNDSKKIIICENILTPLNFKQLLCEILLNDFKVFSFIILNIGPKDKFSSSSVARTVRNWEAKRISD